MSSQVRVRLLIALLLALLAGLGWFRHKIYLAYELDAARRSLDARDFSAAIALLMRAKSVGEHSAEWHYLAARAYRRSGESSAAEEHLARAEALGYETGEIGRQRLLLKAQVGRVHEIRRELEDLIQRDSSDEAAEEIYEAMARGFLTSFDIPEATRCLKYWSEFQPNNPLPHLWMADLFERLESPAGATNEYKTALELDPHRSAVRLKLAQSLLLQLKLEDADAQFRQYLSEHPENAEASIGLAEIARRKGDTDQAKSILCDALVLDMSDEHCAQALVPLAQIAQEEQQYVAAVYLLQRSVELAPQVPTSRMALAAALTAMGDGDLAAQQRALGVELREKNELHKVLVLQLVEKPNDAEIRYKIGMNLMEQGLAPAGADWLKTALRIDPSHPGAHRRLAEYYKRIGEGEQAETHRRLANQSAPPATLLDRD